MGFNWDLCSVLLFYTPSSTGEAWINADGQLPLWSSRSEKIINFLWRKVVVSSRTTSHLRICIPMTDGPACLICFALARQRHNVKPTAITIGCVVEALVINKQGEEAWQLVQDWNDMIYRKSSYKAVGFPIWDVAGSAAVSWPSLGGTARICNSLIIVCYCQLSPLFWIFAPMQPGLVVDGKCELPRDASTILDASVWNLDGRTGLVRDLFARRCSVCSYNYTDTSAIYVTCLSCLSEDDVLSLIIVFRWSGFSSCARLHGQWLPCSWGKSMINTVVYSTVLKGFAVSKRIDKVLAVYKAGAGVVWNCWKQIQCKISRHKRAVEALENSKGNHLV